MRTSFEAPDSPLTASRFGHLGAHSTPGRTPTRNYGQRRTPGSAFSDASDNSGLTPGKMRAPSLLQNFSNADFELEAQGITDAVDAMSPPDLRGLNMHGSALNDSGLGMSMFSPLSKTDGLGCLTGASPCVQRQNEVLDIQSHGTIRQRRRMNLGRSPPRIEPFELVAKQDEKTELRATSPTVRRTKTSKRRLLTEASQAQSEQVEIEHSSGPSPAATDVITPPYTATSPPMTQLLEQSQALPESHAHVQQHHHQQTAAQRQSHQPHQHMVAATTTAAPATSAGMAAATTYAYGSHPHAMTALPPRADNFAARWFDGDPRNKREKKMTAHSHAKKGSASKRGEYKCGKCGFYPKKQKHNCDEEKRRRQSDGRNKSLPKAAAGPLPMPNLATANQVQNALLNPVSTPKIALGGDPMMTPGAW